jgi:hypothetical protein
MSNSYPFAFWALRTGLLLVPAGAALAQAPVITAISPAAHALAAPRTGAITVTCSQPLTAASSGALQVFSSQRGGRRTQATPAVASGSTLRFAPTAFPFMPGETVNYTVTTAAASSTGALAQPKTGWFTTAVAGTGRANFAPPALNPFPTVGAGPVILGMSDVDGDGDLDILTTSDATNTVSVSFNSGTGNFSAGQSVPVGNRPGGLALGDVDGDGDVDFVAANFNDNTVSVRLNNGAGTFTAPALNPNTSVSGSPNRVALGDVDGDGDLDLLASSATNGTVSVRLNNGSGNFTAPALNPNPSVLSGAFTLALGDVDGDGDLDFVTANTSSNNASVRLNNGSGNFTAPATNPNPTLGNWPVGIALADIDGDGDLDFAAANLNDNTISIRLNDGTGNFTSSATAPNIPMNLQPLNIAFGDVDADGDLDILTTHYTANGTVSVRLNNGLGGFAAPATNAASAVGSTPGSIGLGDVDNDGDLDLVTTNPGTSGSNGNTLSVLLNTPKTLATRAETTAVLTLYPNPAQADVTVSGAAPHALLTVFDALGRALFSTTAGVTGSARFTLPANLPTGVYFVRSGQRAQRLAVE